MLEVAIIGSVGIILIALINGIGKAPNS